MENKALKNLPNNAPLWLSNFISVYSILTKNNLTLLETLYADDIKFIDPIHQVNGLTALNAYFNGLYQNLSWCEFDIHEVIFANNQAAVYWTMTYQHDKLNKGKAVSVEGNSRIYGHEDKVTYHRDYVDLGQMIYEQLPIFGTLTKWVKAKVAR